MLIAVHIYPLGIYLAVLFAMAAHRQSGNSAYEGSAFLLPLIYGQKPAPSGQLWTSVTPSSLLEFIAFRLPLKVIPSGQIFLSDQLLHAR